MKKTVSLLSAFILTASCFSSCSLEVEEAVIIQSAGDLEGKKIGTQIGTTGYILASDITNAMVEKYKDGNTALQALEQKKVDAVIIDELTAKELVNGNKSFNILPDPFQEEEYAIAYKKGNAELGEKLDSAIDKLKSDGTLDDISKHWIGSNPDHKSYTSKSDVHREGKLIMATNAEFPPYESMENGEIVGFDVDMATAICDELGMELEIKNMDFSTITTSINLGEADIGIAGISVTPEREEIVDFTQGYAVSSQVIIVRDESE